MTEGTGWRINRPKESVVTGRSTDREVIVTNNEGRSSGALVAGIVAVLVILLAIWFFANNDVGGGDDGVTGTVDVNVSVPATTN